MLHRTVFTALINGFKNNLPLINFTIGITGICFQSMIFFPRITKEFADITKLIKGGK